MENILFGTHTDYTHFSLSDIAKYFENLSITIKSCVNEIKNDINSLSDNYWQKSVYFNFRVQIEDCLKIYQTAYKELNEIKDEILDEVMPHHYSRILRFAIDADKINKNLGKIWGNEYDNKDYDNKDFLLVERIYQDARDMAVELVGLGNIVNRLNDFMGANKEKNEKANINITGGTNINIIDGKIENSSINQGSTIYQSDKKNESKSSKFTFENIVKIIVAIGAVATLSYKLIEWFVIKK